MKRVLTDFRYIFINCFVNHIHIWQIRKLFYKLFGMKIGKKSRIGIRTIVESPGKIIIGRNTVINEYCHLDGRGSLSIGDNCSISVYSKIITATHDKNSDSFDYVKGRVIIKNGVWLGIGAIVLNDSYLEENTLIGAGCVFKGKTVRNGIYIGSPAKKIGTRNVDTIKDLEYRAYFR